MPMRSPEPTSTSSPTSITTSADGHEAQHAAPVDSIVALLRALVAIPSRGDGPSRTARTPRADTTNAPETRDADTASDDFESVLACVETWFAQHGIASQRLRATDSTLVGLVAQIEGSAPTPPTHGERPWYVLNATLDTAGFGDPQSWTHPPLGATLVDGWLVGRGAGDSKAGAAIFAHLLAVFTARRETFAGTLTVLFDVDEHSGRFGGARTFFDRDQPVVAVPGRTGAPRPDGVMIGYPGNDRVMVGARGFLRARLTVRGIAAHSGGSSSRGLSALLRGAALAQTLAALPLETSMPEADSSGVAASGVSGERADDNGAASSTAAPSPSNPAAPTHTTNPAPFDKPAQLTLTAITAGNGGFTQVPDRCELTLDLRLTPHFTADIARQVIEAAIREHDHAYPPMLATTIDWLPGWPAYRVTDAHPMLAALDQAARNEWHAPLPHAVAGPSNIGNYLAALGVPALCGFGVRAEGIHAADERIELASIGSVYRIYEAALHTLLDVPPEPRP